MTKIYKLLKKKRHKNVNLGEKSHKLVTKSHKNVNLGEKKSQTSEEKSQKCKFR